MECPKKCAKIGHAIFGEVLRYGKENFSENVHLCISLREMLKIPHSDAKKGRKNMPVATLLEPAVGSRKGENLHGDVSFPYQVGQET